MRPPDIEDLQPFANKPLNSGRVMPSHGYHDDTQPVQALYRPGQARTEPDKREISTRLGPVPGCHQAFQVVNTTSVQDPGDRTSNSKRNKLATTQTTPGTRTSYVKLSKKGREGSKSNFYITSLTGMIKLFITKTSELAVKEIPSPSGSGCYRLKLLSRSQGSSPVIFTALGPNPSSIS